MEGGGGGGDCGIVAAMTKVAVCGEAKRGPQHLGERERESPGAGARKHGDRVSCFLIYGRQQWAPKKQKTKDGLFISVHCSRGVAPS